MLDIKFIRNNRDMVRAGVSAKGSPADIDRLLEFDELRRGKLKAIEALRSEQNAASEEIAKTTGGVRDEKIATMKELKERLQRDEQELVTLQKEFDALMMQVPNLPIGDVPVGKSATENVVLREAGERPQFDFLPKDHVALGEALDIIDVERAGKVSGTRFGYLKREAALLEFALVQYAFAHLTKNGFSAVVPPVLVREDMMRGMGYIDSTEDVAERYFFSEDRLFLVGTSEQSVGPMHADEVLKEEELPKRYAAFSTCFRREAGSYGKDTRGILRVHQFDKVEMVSFVKPGDSVPEHAFFLKMEEELMRGLHLPYRVVRLCTGDLSSPSAATYDIETWLPGENNGSGEYRETHSSSNTTDYQSRRLNIKFRQKEGGNEYVHILNGTAFAIGRMVIAILENYQQADGSIRIPEVLKPYMFGITEIRR